MLHINNGKKHGAGGYDRYIRGTFVRIGISAPNPVARYNTEDCFGNDYLAETKLI